MARCRTITLGGRRLGELRAALDRLTPLVDALHPMARRQTDTDAILEAVRAYTRTCRGRLLQAGRDPDALIAQALGDRVEPADDGEQFRGVGSPDVD